MSTGEAVQAMVDAFENYLMERENGKKFLFPDEIREILRECPDLTRVSIYDISEFPDVTEVYHYTVVRPSFDSIRYLTRYGMGISEENLALKLYDFIEDGYGVYINGYDILEGGWQK